MTTTDLSTLNVASAVVKKALQDAVCSYEQQALDAARRGEYMSAQTYKQWAFATDLAIHTASAAISALFLEALETMPLVDDLREVHLPAVTRSSEDSYLDDLTVEIASRQPCP